MTVALIDYQAGNLTSVRKALTALGAAILTPSSPADLDRADAIIVPGVGHFEATAALDATWHAAVRSRLDAGVPSRYERRLLDVGREADHAPVSARTEAPDRVEHPGTPQVDQHQHRPPRRTAGPDHVVGAGHGVGQHRRRRDQLGVGEAGPHLGAVHQIGHEGHHHPERVSGPASGSASGGARSGAHRRPSARRRASTT